MPGIACPAAAPHTDMLHTGYTPEIATTSRPNGIHGEDHEFPSLIRWTRGTACFIPGCGCCRAAVS
ncbi:hypothetical protein BPS1E_0357 [Bifidobacterium pseudocatenulatum]|uniref:Uncharacterized protein n=1 Tax=Bifidobacterium pseudocatenulatum TaxID=28026 RepID=A0A267WPE3_BIFPS|nr:hypothetical protein BPS1E_0357 [Bifidobacterium pseudocatenulatum]